MEMPEWRNEYAVGIPEIDAQHKHLFGIAYRLADSVRADAGQTDLKAVIDELISYTNEHFAFEEMIMEQADYEHLMYHRKMHEFMRTRLDLLNAQLMKGFLSEAELVEFMETWLTEHIIMEDMRYIPAVTAKELEGGYP